MAGGTHDYGARMKYPYTISGKVMHFPWKYYWKNARAFRYTAYSLIITFPFFYKMTVGVNSPGNVQMWKEIRAKRKHDHFAPPSDH